MDLTCWVSITIYYQLYKLTSQVSLVTALIEQDNFLICALSWTSTSVEMCVNSSYSLISFFFCYQQFLFIFSHTTQHNIQIKQTKQQTHTQHLKVQSKGRERGKDNKNTKVTPLHNRVYQQKTLPSLNGWRPGPTDSRRCTFTCDNLQEATDPICLSTHVRCKPVLNYCLLHSCKTSKQHSLLHWANTEIRIIIKKTQTWVNRPINSQ